MGPFQPLTALWLRMENTGLWGEAQAAHPVTHTWYHTATAHANMQAVGRAFAAACANRKAAGRDSVTPQGPHTTRISRGQGWTMALTVDAVLRCIHTRLLLGLQPTKDSILIWVSRGQSQRNLFQAVRRAFSNSCTNRQAAVRASTTHQVPTPLVPTEVKDDRRSSPSMSFRAMGTAHQGM